MNLRTLSLTVFALLVGTLLLACGDTTITQLDTGEQADSSVTADSSEPADTTAPLDTSEAPDSEQPVDSSTPPDTVVTEEPPPRPTGWQAITGASASTSGWTLRAVPSGQRFNGASQSTSGWRLQPTR